MLFTLAVRGEVSNHLMHALRYLRANGLALSEQHWGQTTNNQRGCVALYAAISSTSRSILSFSSASAIFKS